MTGMGAELMTSSLCRIKRPVLRDRLLGSTRSTYVNIAITEAGGDLVEAWTGNRRTGHRSIFTGCIRTSGITANGGSIRCATAADLERSDQAREIRARLRVLTRRFAGQTMQLPA